MKKGEILYAKKGSTYVFKYIGDVRYTMCPPLNQFVTELYERDDLRDIIIDLTEVDLSLIHI